VLPQSQAPHGATTPTPFLPSSRFPPLFFIRLWAVNKKHQNEADFKKQKKRFKPPCRGGWVGQSTKKGRGQIYFPDIFCRVFELPSPRYAQKHGLFYREKSVLDFW
jgi:hypothetical protein